ncbi:hypothetical protein PaeBR_02385 [Paenibacillus sp. BR2-3]
MGCARFVFNHFLTTTSLRWKIYT